MEESWFFSRYMLYGMHGNVWEWTQDSWQDFLVGEEDPVHIEPNSDRIIRGGSWGGNARYLRSANRGFVFAGNGYNLIGFRLVRTL